jgi:hypothetical protein
MVKEALPRPWFDPDRPREQSGIFAAARMVAARVAQICSA